MKNRGWLLFALCYLLMLFSCEGNAKPKIETIQLNETNTIAYADYIGPYSVDLIASAVTAKRIMAGDQPIYLLISSPGGLYDYAKVLKYFMDRVPDLVMICKNCHSAAGMVFATSSNKRYVLDSSLLMMHEMYNMKMTARDVKNQKMVDSLVEASREFNTLMANKLKMDVDKYEAKIANTEWTLKGQQFVDNHLADAVIKVECNPYIKSIAPSTCGAE